MTENVPEKRNAGWFGPTDTSHDDDVRRLHAEGKGRNDIGRDLDIPFGTVSNIAKRLGLRFDGSQVLMATEVRRRELAERRAALSLALVEKAEGLMERLDGKMTYTVYGGKDFEQRVDEYDQPIPQDQAHLARAISTLLERSVRLEEFERGGAGLEGAVNFLDGVTLTIRGTAVPELEPGE